MSRNKRWLIETLLYVCHVCGSAGSNLAHFSEEIKISLATNHKICRRSAAPVRTNAE